MSESPIELRGKGGGVVFQGTQSPGGGSQTLTTVRVPIAFDTPGIAVGPQQTFPIIGIDMTDPFNPLITIAGNHVALFPPLTRVIIVGSTGNDGNYGVTSSALVSGNTVLRGIFVLDPTPDGDVVLGGGASTGIPLWTPTPGDALLLDLCYLSIPTPFDGTNTAVNLTYSDLAGEFGSLSIVGVQDFAAADSHSTIPVFSLGGSGGLFAQSGEWLLPDATPLRLVIDDGAAGNPGMAAGAGEVVLVILAAA